MATMTERLAFLISANADDAIRAFEKTGNAAEKELGKAEDKLGKLGSQMTVFGAGAMAFAGVAGKGLYELAQASEDAEMQSRKLANSIANNGTYAQGAQKRLEDLAKATMQVTAADDDAIVGAQALMVQFGLNEQQITTLTPLVVDLSRKMGVDMDTAAKAVAKSVDGTSTALKKMGIDVQSTKDGGDAFNNTVDALRSSVGGFAQQEAETFSGKMEKLKVSLGNLAEGVGSGVVDAFGGFASVLTKGADALGNLSPAAQNAAGRFAAVGTAVVGVAGALSFVAGQAIKMKDRFTDAEGSLNNFGKAAKFASIGLAAIGASQAAFDVLNQIGDISGKTERNLQGLTIAAAGLADATAGPEALMKSFRDLVKTEDEGLKFSHIWEDFGKEILLVGGANARNIEDIDRAFDKVLKTSPEVAQKLLDVWRTQADALDHNSSQYADNISLIERYQKRVDLQVGSTKALATVTGDASDASGDFAGALDDEAQAAKDAADAHKEQEDAINGAMDAARSAVDASFALRDAQRDYRDALAELNDVNADASKTEDERAAALDRAAQAAIKIADSELRLAEQRAEAAGVTLTSADREAIWRKSLLDTAQVLDPSGALSSNLYGIADQVSNVAGQKRLEIRADTSDATNKLSGLRSTVSGLAPWMEGAGYDIGAATADGMERGIEDRQEAVASAAARIGQKAVDTVKRLLGIFSPSRVMADEVGAPIAEGIAVGIDESSNSVTSALDAVGSDIITRAGKIVSDANAVIEQVVQSAQDAFNSTVDLIEGRRDQEDAARNVREAEDRVAEAQKRVRDALKDSGKNSAEYKQAQEALAAAQKNLEDANYRLLQVSYDLIEQGPEGIAQFEGIARAAGLNKDEVAALVQAYMDLAAARIAEAEAYKKAEEIKNAEDGVGGGDAQDKADAATKALQDKIAERNKLKSQGKDYSVAEKEAARLAVEAAKAYAATKGDRGTDNYLKAELEALQFFAASTPWLADDLANLIETLKSKLPKMALGGIVSSPTLAMIGEAGPEAVVPLDRMSGLNGAPQVIVNVAGSVVTERELVRTIRDALIAEQRRGKQLVVA